MFSQIKYILSINRKTISLFKSALSKDKVEEKVFEKEWNQQELSEILKELRKQYKFSILRVLLSDDLSYEFVLRFPKQDFEKSSNKRDLVFSKTRELIPEILTNGEWDFKEEISQEKNEVQIRVFAPLKQLTLQIEKAAIDNKITIEAIETMTNASSRNADPVKSILTKKDIFGKDEEVLNIQLSAKNTQQQKTEKTGTIIVTAIFIIIVICMIGFFFYLKR